MDVKRYSLNDIFGFLWESTSILYTPVKIDYEEDGRTKQEDVQLNEYIAMALASELISRTSRMASDRTTAKQEDVLSAMKAHGYDEVAFPVYGNHFGIIMSGGTRRHRQSRTNTSKAK